MGNKACFVRNAGDLPDNYDDVNLRHMQRRLHTTYGIHKRRLPQDNSNGKLKGLIAIDLYRACIIIIQNIR